MRRGRVVLDMEAALSAECERARALASQAVDCELSEFERRQLKAHLADCPSCETFLVALRDVTHELRAAPLPKPSRPLVPRLRSRPPLYLAALAIAVAAAGGVVAGSLTTTPVHATAAHAAQSAQPVAGARLPHRTPV